MASRQCASDAGIIEKRDSLRENGKSPLVVCSEIPQTRRLFIMRHGERCDFAFGRSWVSKCFDDKGNYTQTDLNLPPTMISRDNHLDFIKDSPLTEAGKFQARSTGDALKREGVNIKHVYSSPSLRCVQTAQNVIDDLYYRTVWHQSTNFSYGLKKHAKAQASSCGSRSLLSYAKISKNSISSSATQSPGCVTSKIDQPGPSMPNTDLPLESRPNSKQPAPLKVSNNAVLRAEVIWTCEQFPCIAVLAVQMM
ncbi:ubiquitin-associated and sh3 domain-containing protein b [Plakobranchus ocellatus]|uniref:Ubiquitin-associated and sh3 domain-containing protein b n=1 Tax=Plakobranchus ocellatus TaxID=259542 RepID=A0AAV4DAH9_9GAST|nr:ubiquitin-associated and sh3 domain-containing protein b [Plakobranchus ocellatus]